MKSVDCPVCTHKSVSNVTFYCANCETQYTEASFFKYLVQDDEDNYRVFPGPRTQKLVTPEMRERHFRATGMYEEDLLIWVWHKAQDLS